MKWSKEFHEYMLAKYDDNHWWELEDDKEVARYQLYEPRLAVPFQRFHKGMEELLGHPIWTHQFANMKRLQEELESKQ